MRSNDARPAELARLAERYVALAFEPRRLSGAKVDLYRLAQSRNIHTVELKPLLADGYLVVDDKGFSVHLHDERPSVTVIGEASEYRTLNVKQRFTFAHEIAHTMTYDLSHETPQPKKSMMDVITGAGGRDAESSLEAFCQIVAGLILLPISGLRQEEVLGRFGTVDSVATVLRIARLFEVSPEVVMHRVTASGDSDALKPPYLLTLLVRKSDKHDIIRAYIYTPTLKGIARQPTLYSRMRTWVMRTPVLKDSGILDANVGEWSRSIHGGVVHTAKKPYGRGNDAYFVEMKYNPQPAM